MAKRQQDTTKATKSKATKPKKTTNSNATNSGKATESKKPTNSNATNSGKATESKKQLSGGSGSGCFERCSCRSLLERNRLLRAEKENLEEQLQKLQVAHEKLQEQLEEEENLKEQLQELQVAHANLQEQLGPHASHAKLQEKKAAEAASVELGPSVELGRVRRCSHARRAKETKRMQGAAAESYIRQARLTMPNRCACDACQWQKQKQQVVARWPRLAMAAPTSDASARPAEPYLPPLAQLDSDDDSGDESAFSEMGMLISPKVSAETETM